jgi:hypothetical protein
MVPAVRNSLWKKALKAPPTDGNDGLLCPTTKPEGSLIASALARGGSKLRVGQVRPIRSKREWLGSRRQVKLTLASSMDTVNGGSRSSRAAPGWHAAENSFIATRAETSAHCPYLHTISVQPGGFGPTTATA